MHTVIQTATVYGFKVQWRHVHRRPILHGFSILYYVPHIQSALLFPITSTSAITQNVRIHSITSGTSLMYSCLWVFTCLIHLIRLHLRAEHG